MALTRWQESRRVDEASICSGLPGILLLRGGRAGKSQDEEQELCTLCTPNREPLQDWIQTQ